MKTIIQQCQLARKEYQNMAQLDATQKTSILSAMSKAILNQKQLILSENSKDMALAKKNKMSPSLQDRLFLNNDRLEAISQSIKSIANFADPIGDILEKVDRPNGLYILKKRVPLGVIGMIYEARPNVTADAIALAIKSGNALVLRGSASAYHSNVVLRNVMVKAALEHGLAENSIQVLEDTSREGVKLFVSAKGLLDLVIPRGGAHLINHVVDHSKVPCIETGVGNCHVYIDRSANFEQAIKVTINAKTQRPSVCNSCESLLLDKRIPSSVLEKLGKALSKQGVKIYSCPEFKKIHPEAFNAQESDWETEYLDLIISIKMVDDVDHAIKHIHQYGSQHSEAILAQDEKVIEAFTQQVDAASVLVNASTRFTDGGEFGFGAEIGISTQKLHARGPMGIHSLCSYKYIVRGNGQIK